MAGLPIGAGDGSKAITLMEKIEQGIVPRIAEAMTKIEAEVQRGDAPPPIRSILAAGPQLQAVRRRRAAAD